MYKRCVGRGKTQFPRLRYDQRSQGFKIFTKHKHHTERTWARDSIIALVILQYLPEGRLGCEVLPASYSGANMDVNVRAEECLDIEEEVSPMPTTSLDCEDHFLKSLNMIICLMFLAVCHFHLLLRKPNIIEIKYCVN
jgi:hypothetical protein